MTKVNEVFGKSGLWGGNLKIYEFTHEAPSRSGEATISVTVSGDDSLSRKVYIISYAHHEGLASYYPKDWAEFVEEMQSTFDKSNDKWDKEAASQILAIDKIIQDILTK